MRRVRQLRADVLWQDHRAANSLSLPRHDRLTRLVRAARTSTASASWAHRRHTDSDAAASVLTSAHQEVCLNKPPRRNETRQCSGCFRGDDPFLCADDCWSRGGMSGGKHQRPNKYKYAVLDTCGVFLIPQRRNELHGRPTPPPCVAEQSPRSDGASALTPKSRWP